jgi:Fur family iron response transcriptional regulator
MDRARANPSEWLTAAGVRPTAPRLAIASALLSGPHRHLTARDLHLEVASAGRPVALGTVYNTVSELVRAGLLAEVVVDGSQVWYDTHVAPHCHVYDVDAGTLRDAPLALDRSALPIAEDEEVVDLDLLIRVRRRRAP